LTGTNSNTTTDSGLGMYQHL